MELVISGELESLQDSLLHTIKQPGISLVEIQRGHQAVVLNDLSTEITDHGRSPILHKLIMTTTGDLPAGKGQVELSKIVAQRIAPDTTWVLESHDWVDRETPAWAIPYLDRTYPYDRQGILTQFIYDNEAYDLLNKLASAFTVVQLEQIEVAGSLSEYGTLDDFNLRALATYTRAVLETPGVITLAIGEPQYNPRSVVVRHKTKPNIAAILNLDYIDGGADDNLDLLATIRQLAKTRAI